MIQTKVAVVGGANCEFDESGNNVDLHAREARQWGKVAAWHQIHCPRLLKIYLVLHVLRPYEHRILSLTHKIYQLRSPCIASAVGNIQESSDKRGYLRSECQGLSAKIYEYALHVKTARTMAFTTGLGDRR